MTLSSLADRGPESRLGAVILAAGASSRMGRPKALLPWGASTVVGSLISAWQAVADPVAVVIAPGSPAIAEAVNRCGAAVIMNPHAGLGMFSSIQAASAWEGWPDKMTHCVIALGDQPQLDPRTALAPLVPFVWNHPECICQPSFSGAPKHPVVLPSRIFRSLAGSHATSLKEVLAGQEIRLLALDDPRLNADLDFPADYDRARSAWDRPDV